MEELYASLPVSAPGFVRFADILPGQPSDEISIELIPGSLESDIQYEALSYTWGSAENPKAIICSGSRLEVTQNLHSALRRLRKTDAKRRLWIDAICINQSDYDERAEQVKIMRTIYERAFFVWADVGDDVENMDEMKSLMRDLYQALLERDDDTLPFTEADFERHGLPSSKSAGWTAWQRFLSRPYHTRLWIVQEFAVAKKLNYLAGSQPMMWEIPFALISKMQIHGIAEDQRLPASSAKLALSAVKGKNAIRNLVKVRERVQRVLDDNSITMDDLLWVSRFSDATDPKDKIFAVLGLATDIDIDQPGLEIRYGPQESVAQVYTRVACTLIRSNRDNLCTFLYEAGSAFKPRQADLPSWVPDWSSPRAGSPLGGLAKLVKYHAADSLPTAFELDEKTAILHIRSSVFDTINAITYEYRPDSDGEEGHGGVYYGIEVVKWLRAAIDIKPSEPEYSPTSASVEDAFWRTLIGNKTHLDTPAPDNYAEQFTNLMIRQKHVEDELARTPDIDTSRFAVPDPCREYAKADAGSRLYRQGLQNMMYTKAFGITEAGYMGIFPSGSQIGDRVCLIAGAYVPFVVRKVGSSDWILIGECYVHGVMSGELLRKTVVPDWQQLSIR